MLLGRCEFAHDDYSLNIVELPVVEEGELEEEQDEAIEVVESQTQLPMEQSLF